MSNISLAASVRTLVITQEGDGFLTEQGEIALQYARKVFELSYDSRCAAQIELFTGTPNWV